MNAIAFVLGGARSGKSAFAQRLALERGGEQVLFVATLRETDAIQNDPEMQRRLARHRAERPTHWHTVVLADDLHVISAALLEREARCVLLDCLSLYISGCLFMGETLPPDPEQAAADATKALLNAIRATACPWVIVSNEVGLSVAPDNAAGRAYRDALGRANQIVAQAADEVYLLVAGLPLRLK
ncbi:MAG: bifunctional adenosylcobinamide kinase/adenosylcobinamide-phosphate guanylyltransferase [Anaerolineae bacterium]|nr:bifunctional adenosylcobinamide kinase/adenosylcobinamide-phosphate guanylyltransferase [Thermoflexales bacterium]MDW8394831.1 bifunctional adenosylcobinamide kinase/adenosylcobinamide-phosphate guanylyltransferase [Anaerolineae bacterium]